MRRIQVWAGLALFLLPGVVAVAQRALPMSLDGMVRQAGIIVHGRVIATETGRDPRTGLPATWTTIEVRENFYGATSSTVRYKQFGGTADGIVTPTPDLPRLATGEEVVLLLYPPSKQAGFQSPVGLAQGIFRITTAGSSKRVTQVARTPQLLKSTARGSALPQRDGSFDLESFSKTLRTLVREVKP